MRSSKKNISYAVLVKFWQAVLLLLGFCSVVPAIYSGGDNCKLHYRNDDDSKGMVSGGESGESSTLVCSVKTVDENFSVANLTASSVNLESVEKVVISCKEIYYYQSVVQLSTFYNMDRISDLEILHCKISKLGSDVFSSFKSLKHLALRTRNLDWPVMSLSIEANVFRPLPFLERLDLSTNSIWEIPNGVFCPLHNLKDLNISHNHIQDLTQLGFSGSAGSANRSSPCKLDITSLDLSHNDADVMVSGALKGLTQLEELHLQSNNIGKIDDEALEGLRTLSTLDLSNNRLVALPENVFMHTPNLMYIHVRNNSLTVLAPGLFRGLEYLVKLDLSYNELQSEWLTEFSFQDLIRLVVLDLSHNKISQLNQQVFRDMYSVQELRLSHNQLMSLSGASFSPCVNLHTLDLSYNQIESIPAKAFDGVDVLSFLALDNNQIKNIEKAAFSNLKSLEDLNINGNKLREVPEAISHLRYLKALDLGDNLISSLRNLPVNGLDLLYGLRLVNNKISGNISRDTFVNIPSLKILNLAKNDITHIDSGTFTGNRNLQAVRLDANSITSISNLFDSLPNLEWLNVSDNNIEVFDYHFIPPSLLWLDLHKNKIAELGNSLGRHDLNLQTLDASFNRLTNISSIQIPKSIQLVFLNDNEISVVEQYTFLNKENLTRVDLFANKLTKMDMQALRLIPLPPDKPLPQFYLGGNSFICDCDMEWLQRINNLKHDRCYPTIMDLDSIYCQMPFIRGGVYLPLVDIQPSQFLCQYVSHCFTLCHCCEFDACDCEMSCPDGCRCYHDQSWRSNIVNCSAYDLFAVPDRIPMDATEVYLDGNDFKNLSSHSFIGRKHMQILYVNASNVNTLDNETFSGLTRLTVLHLEDNLLETLRGHEFKYLSPLRELYLHNNKLRYIHQHTFVDMSHLEILTLHDNRLINFPVWRMVDNPYLMKISLRNNLWTCECQFVESFEIWVMDNVRKVIDSDELKCISTSDESPDSYIIDFNATNCLNSSSTSTVIQPMIFHNLLHPVIAIVVAFIVLVLLLICFFYRNTLRVWMFSKYGLRLCYTESYEEDKDKIFDAFVSYSSKDEVWVNQILAAQLERGEKPYRVCLHYRDFPVTAYITETMVEAVESSKRTIIVLSKNFIENEWCRFQFKSAHHEVLKKKRKKIIVVVLGDIPSRDLDADLKLYLKTNTCIRSTDKLFWEKLRFALPDVSSCHRAVHTYSTIPERPGVNKYSVNGPSNSLHGNHVQGSDAYWA
ncbi:UNVERIFIED_CONTAM: hypothetical protein RMT77_016479 [Armadillidium vulgare]|nr:Toll-like receptor 6 [Armadillidium vulgare]